MTVQVMKRGMARIKTDQLRNSFYLLAVASARSFFPCSVNFHQREVKTKGPESNYFMRVAAVEKKIDSGTLYLRSEAFSF